MGGRAAPDDDSGEGADDSNHAEAIIVIYLVYLLILNLAKRDGFIDFPRWINVILALLPFGFLFLWEWIFTVFSRDSEENNCP